MKWILLKHTCRNVVWKKLSLGLCLILLSLQLYSPSKPYFCFSVEINYSCVPVGILLKIHLDYPLKQRKEQSKLILCSFHSNFGLLFILGFILLPILSLLLSKSLWQNNTWSVRLAHFFSLPLFLLLCICVSSNNWAWFCGLYKDLL